MIAEFGALNTVIGRQRTTEDYFLAGRNMPWPAVGMSMFASLTSATTYLGVPAFAYEHNVAMIFGVLMSLVAAPILARLFYPVYRRHRVTTSYEYILLRYGRGARAVVSGLFVLGRLGWLGIVIYAPAMALTVASGMSLTLAVALMGLLAVTYTVLGGLSAVIWTDVVQFVVLLGGAVWLIGTLVVHVPGGAAEMLHTAIQAGKFEVFDWTNLGELTALSATIGWFFVFTDRGVVKAIAFNAVNDVLINGMLIFIGIGTFAYFRAFPGRLDPAVHADGILPFYIMHRLPPGISGLMVTAIFAAAMSSVDSGINSLATVIVNDWIKPLRRERSSSVDVALARVLTLALGLLATAAALCASRIGDIVRMWMNIVGLFAAPVLGIFVLGLLTRRATFPGWLVGASLAIALTLFLQWRFADELMAIWLFPISFLVTATAGYAFSRLLGGPSAS